MAALSRALQSMESLNYKTSYIVLDNAHRLLDCWPELIPGLFRLEEATGRQVCVVIITSSSWQQMHNHAGGLQPLSVRFGLYTPEVMVEILLRAAEVEHAALFGTLGRDRLKGILQLAVPGLQHCTRDLAVMSQAVRRLLGEMEAILDRTGVDTDTKLSKQGAAKLMPTLNKAVRLMVQALANELFHHDYPDDSLAAAAKAMGSKSSSSTTVPAKDNNYLSDHGKFVMLAAFLASYNPAQQDRRMFSSHATKKQRVVRSKKETKLVMPAVLLGPKPFLFPRMIAILKAISDDRDCLKGLELQVAALQSLNLLEQTGSRSLKKDRDDDLETVRLRCNIGYDDALSMAMSVGFDLGNYLSCTV